MHFIHNIDFIAAELGRIFDGIAQIAHFIHAVVAGGVDFDDIEALLMIHPLAVGTFPAWITVDGMLAVNGFRQNFGGGCFSCSAGSAEQVRMRDPVVDDLIPQGFDNCLLADHM